MVTRKNPLWYMVFIYLVCILIKGIEFLFLRTDETIFADNFINKLVGIMILVIVCKKLKYSSAEIGFDFKKLWTPLSIGLGMGVLSFGVAYGVEFAILKMQGLEPVFEFFVGGFSLTGDTVKNTGTVFVVMCILFNLINVVMEEGVFRGLFLNLCNERYTFAISNLIVAFLFGIWHFVMPLRSYMDGQIDFYNMMVLGIGYIILAGLMSIKWGVLREMSGVLWIGFGEHFFNNTIQNLLHITTTTGVDELQIARIIFAQLLTFIVVMVVYRKRYYRGM